MILAANMAGQQAAPTLTPETAILPGLNQRTDTIRIDLEDSDLWTVFNTDLTNEMVCTALYENFALLDYLSIYLTLEVSNTW